MVKLNIRQAFILWTNYKAKLELETILRYREL